MSVSNQTPPDNGSILAGDAIAAQITHTSATEVTLSVNADLVWSLTAGTESGFAGTVNTLSGVTDFTFRKTGGWDGSPLTVTVVITGGAEAGTTTWTVYVNSNATYSNGLKPYNETFQSGITVQGAGVDIVQNLQKINFVNDAVTETSEGVARVVTVGGAGSTSDDISNESSVSGTTVTDALNTLLAATPATAGKQPHDPTDTGVVWCANYADTLDDTSTNAVTMTEVGTGFTFNSPVPPSGFEVVDVPSYAGQLSDKARITVAGTYSENTTSTFHAVTGDRSVFMKVYVNSTGSGATPYFIQSGANDAALLSNYAMGLISGQLFIQAGNGSITTKTDTVLFPLDRYVYVGHTVISGTMRAYINGVEVMSQGSWPDGPGTGNLYTGSAGTGSAGFLKGALSTSCVWDRGLTAQEVLDNTKRIMG